MAFIEPFRGVRYNEKFEKTLGNIITPPYDKIDKEEIEIYKKKNPYNFVNLILNDHEEAKKLLTRWLKEGILVRDTTPSLYYYIQEFEHPITGKTLKRKSIIALIKLEEFGNGIFPHEKTLQKPKEDRLNLLRKTNANLGQVFMLYEDKKDTIVHFIENSIQKKNPLYSFEGVLGKHHTLWKINDKETIESVKEMLLGKDLVIADGHHRYEVSNIYKKEMKKNINQFSYPENPEFVMGTLVNIYSESIVILPTHRYIEIEENIEDLIKKWRTYFYIKEVDKATDLKKLMEQKKDSHPIGAYTQERYLLLTPIEERLVKFFDWKKSKRWNMLDVNILHRAIIEHIKIKQINFFREWERCLSDKIRKNSNYICFFLNPTDKFDVLKIAKKLEKMPQKSTDFYPKLPSGLILNKMILKDEKP